MKNLIRKTIVLLLLAASILVVPYSSKPAYASCCGCCSCTDLIDDDLTEWIEDVIDINLHLFIQFLLNRQMFWDYVFWQQEMLPAFMNMGEQMSAVGMQQVMIIGTFMDAQDMMETQKVLQELQAKAHKDYHPSIDMCEFGTRMKSLAATERKSEFNALTLSERSIDRLLGNTAAAGAGGSGDDVRFRFYQFQNNFCDIHDEGDALDIMCPQRDNIAAMTMVQRDRMNADIDYQKVVQDPWTIGLDLTDNTNISAHEREVFALASNLYGYEGFSRHPAEILQNDPDVGLKESQEAYMELRSTVAKSSVAENSFNAILALKSEGTNGAYSFLEAYLEELGVDDADGDGNVSDEIQDMLGQNPSYYAQMEILTKKAYQSAKFYTNLYDKPANVKRKEVAMQAIGLIQKFDLLKSYLRTESSLSVLLELSVSKIQDEVEDAISRYQVGSE